MTATDPTWFRLSQRRLEGPSGGVERLVLAPVGFAVAHVRRRGDWHALSHLEEAAVWQMADRLGVDDDQRRTSARRMALHARTISLLLAEGGAELHGRLARVARQPPSVCGTHTPGW